MDVRGKVLLLGAPVDTITLLHYAEHMARLPKKRVIRYREPLLVNGERVWVEIEEFDTSQPVVPGAWESYFADIVQEYFASGRAGQGRSGMRHHICSMLPTCISMRWRGWKGISEHNQGVQPTAYSVRS